jgi:hypothetical protein
VPTSSGIKITPARMLLYSMSGFGIDRPRDPEAAGLGNLKETIPR